MNPGSSSKKKQDYDCSSGGSHWKGSQALCMLSESVFSKGPFPLENLYPPVPRYSRRGLAEFSPRTLRIWLLREAGGEKNGTWDSSFLLYMTKWKLYSRKLTRSTTKGDPIGKRKDIHWIASFKQARRKLLAQQ